MNTDEQEQRIQARVCEVVDTAPPVSDETKRRIADLITPIEWPHASAKSKALAA